MTKNYLSAEALTTLLTNIRQNMETGDIEKCTRILVESVDALNQAQHEEIDRAYIGSLREKKRMTQIEDVRRMLERGSVLRERLLALADTEGAPSYKLYTCLLQTFSLRYSCCLYLSTG